jgi:DNA gyrase subunit B
LHNNINTHEGGTHLEGFRRALTRCVQRLRAQVRFFKAEHGHLAGEDIREGLTAIISVKLVERSLKARPKPSWATAKCARSSTVLFQRG